MPSVVVYSRPGCHLCENVITELERIRATCAAIDISTEDITTNPILLNRFHDLIPVVSVDGKIKLAGAVLSNPRTLRDVLSKAIFST
ncbi:MAG TPA: glutaredoxin family protein [Candidatus Bathyarchaeia archaeon]|nr:glutaredoxin family protein [Candidatus Bathyarchaeia archaeon]